MPDETSVPLSQWTTFVHDLVDVAFDLINDDPTRIGKLVEHLGTVSESDQTRILDKLDDVAATALLDEEARFQLWRDLDTLVAKHQKFPNAVWSYKAEQLQRIETATRKMRPAGDPRSHSHLFGWHPDLDGVDDSDFDAYNARLSELRNEAITALLAAPHRMVGLTSMTLDAPAPGLVGASLANDPTVSLEEMLPWLGSDRDALRNAATVWVHNHVQNLAGIDWLRLTLADAALTGAARETFLRALPVERSVWQLVEARESDGDF
jgi:hypothetical protein